VKYFEPALPALSPPARVLLRTARPGIATFAAGAAAAGCSFPLRGELLRERLSRAVCLEPAWHGHARLLLCFL